MKDFQRSKLYKWEELEYGWDDTILSLEECQSYCNTLIKGVTVTDGRGRRTPCAKTHFLRREIALPRFARKKWIVIHEVAHFLTHDKHGPKYVRAYIDILAREYGRSIESLVASATEYGLEIAAPPTPNKQHNI